MKLNERTKIDWMWINNKLLNDVYIGNEKTCSSCKLRIFNVDSRMFKL